MTSMSAPRGGRNAPGGKVGNERPGVHLNAATGKNQVRLGFVDTQGDVAGGAASETERPASSRA